MASIALLGIGVTAAIGAIGSLMKAEVDAREREKIHRLAVDMFEELRGTGEYAQAPLDGDFQDRSEPGYTWSATLDPTGVENLNTFRVTVSKTGQTKLDTTVSGLIYQAPVQTEGGMGGG